MIYLFIHQNFPGQYRHLIRHLADQPGNRVIAISQPNPNQMRRVEKRVYSPDVPVPLNCHKFTVDFELAVRNGMGVAEICRDLAAEGVRPDVIVGHNGWGELMFVKEVFPDVPLLAYFEFYYHAQNVDVGFDPEYPAHPHDAFRLRTKNAVNLLGTDVADWGNAPTRWQRAVHPPEFRNRISVLHEGVDTQLVRPDPSARVSLARDGVTLSPDDEVVTYVARNLEPYRGFHIFMRAAREILKRRPRAHIVAIGGDGVSYGAPPSAGTTYRDIALRELPSDFDMNRLHFLGQIPHEAYLKVLQISSAHIYLTYPFVLSWSFIEAMSAGCLLIGSSTPPVMEVLRDRENGLAVDFFSPRDIADRVDEALDAPDRMASLRAQARADAVRDFDLATATLPKWLGLLDALVVGRRPEIFL